MRKKIAVLVLALAFLCAASAAWCQDAIYVKMPVKGLQYESSRQEIFSYEGDVHLYWIPSMATGSAAVWTVVGALEVECIGLFCCRGATFRGFSMEKVTAASGDVVPLEIEFWASCFGGDPWFQGLMRVYATVPK
jgi:hypothetical protein